MKKYLILVLLCVWSLAPAQDEIVRSPLDGKQYRFLELENRLKVLLVSDSRADKSAASLDVFVGSGSDPEDWEGLAHFLEHMLFLGTEKYPNAGEYQEFIRNNGGGNNAYTSFSHTNYYFSIPPDSFVPALDRFSRFFIDPTFDAVYVDRERAVVHSEYQARKKDEYRRMWDARKRWLHSDHPATQFSVGSEYTLRDRDGVSARDRLIAFYESNYSANIMSLVVVGRESLDELEAMVVSRFSEIPDRNLSPQLFDEPYFDQSLVPAKLSTVPEKDLNSLSFVFPVPSTYYEYRTKPFSYISNLLGHEGEGSLFAVLKDKGWIESLSAGPGYTDPLTGEFTVTIGLTESGVEYVEDIGELLFGAIALIREQGIDAWRYEEQGKLSEIAFRFAEEADSGQLARSLASRMQLYDVDDVLYGPYMMEGFEPDRISELLTYLNPDNVNVNLASRTLETDRLTENYDVAYSLESISLKTLERWRGASPDSVLALPGNNPFIPERLVIQELENSTEIPVRIGDHPGITTWFRGDSEFETPRANFYFNVLSPLTNASPRNVVLTELMVRMINDQLKNRIYDAYLADLEFSLYRHARGISVRISGYEDKQSELLAILVGALANPEFDEDRFSVVKQALQRSLANVSLESPSNQATHEIYRLLMDPYWTESERTATLRSVSLESLKSYVPEFFRRMRITVLSHGDVTEEKTLERVGIVADLIDGNEIAESVDRPQIRMLRRGRNYLRTKRVDHTDSALVAYFQGTSDSRKERATVAMLENMLGPAFYNQIRTVNQAGYLVYAYTMNIDKTPALVFAVQSPNYTPNSINELYNEFIVDYESMLSSASEAEFDLVRNGLIARILERDKTLGDRTRRYWNEIDDEEFSFDTREKFVAELDSLTLDDIRAYYQSKIKTYPARLLVQSPGKGLEDGTGLVDGTGFTLTGAPEVFHQAKK